VSNAAALEALGVGAVLDHVADPLAVVAGHVVHLTLLRTVPSDVAGLVALVASLLVLTAVPGDVPRLVAPVAALLLF